MPATAHRTRATFNPGDRSESDIGYLLRRAGFGAAPDGVRAAAGSGLGALVGTLVDYDSVPDPVTPPPAQILSFRQKGSQVAEWNALSVWWINRMLTAARPLQEKMVLFWHGHFATGSAKVRSTLLMYRQNQLFRDNALGRFDDILSAVYKDPAMLIWLDGYRNTKAAPNENWGREVMELFTLGHGNYTEDDVHASSRAFTGWRLLPDGSAAFAPRLHDDGSKTLLGQTGNWDGEDAVRILAAHTATGPFLATRLWRFFASDRPSNAAIQKLARTYYDSGHSIREMVRALLTMPEFYAAGTRNGHIKSPAELVVTTLKQLGITGADLSTLPRLLTLLGQELFNPPNVGGWPGGPTWINAATMLGRFNFAASLTGVAPRGMGTIDPQAILGASGALDVTGLRSTTAAQIKDALILYVAEVLGVDLTASTRRALSGYLGNGPFDPATLEAKIRGLVQLALVSPEYQAS